MVNSMKKMLVLLIFLFIMGGIVSCGKSETPPTQPTAPSQAGSPDQPAITPPIQVPTTGKVDMAVKKLFDKGLSATNFYVSRNTLHEKPIVIKIYVRNNLQKYVLYNENRYNAGDYYDAVYLDTVKKTAIAYCEDKNSVACPERAKQWTLNFNEVYTKNPVDWLKEFDPSTATIISSETLNGRPSTVVSTVYKGEPVKMWLDNYSGIPIRIEIGASEFMQDKDVYVFDEVEVKGVRESEVTR